MDKPIAWACRVCGAVYSNRWDRDMCEEIHAEQEERLQAEALEE